MKKPASFQIATTMTRAERGVLGAEPVVARQAERAA